MGPPVKQPCGLDRIERPRLPRSMWIASDCEYILFCACAGPVNGGNLMEEDPSGDNLFIKHKLAASGVDRHGLRWRCPGALHRPMSRFPVRRFLIGLTILLLAGGVAFVFKSAALQVVILVSALAVFGWRWPTAGFSLLLFFCNFQYLLGLDRGVLYYAGAGLGAVVAFRLREAIATQVREFERSPLLLVAIGFVALNLAHPILGDWKQQGANVVYTLMVPATLLIARHFAQRGERDLIIIPVLAAGLYAGVLSVVFMYAPLPFLFMARSFDHMRLSGALDGPNAMGRLIAPAMLIAAVLAARSRQSLWVLSLIVLSILLATTLSKMTIGALAVALAIGAAPHETRRACIAAAATVVIAAVAWPLTLGPVVQERAARIWDQQASVVAWQDKTEQSGIFKRLLRDYRIGYSIPTVGNQRDALTDHDVWHTGRRYATWAAGVEIFLEHPIWGIGTDTWPEAMVSHIGTPFSSPHNGLLEALGSYGMLGGALYLALLGGIVVTFRRAYPGADGDDKLIVIGVGMFVIMLLVRELAEPQAILVAYPYLFWVWAAFGLVETPVRLVASGESRTKASAAEA